MYGIKKGINWTLIINQLQYGLIKFEDLEPAEQTELRQIFGEFMKWASNAFKPCHDVALELAKQISKYNESFFL